MSNLPDGWDIAPLAELVKQGCPIVYGIVQAGPHIPDGIPYIRVSDMAKGFLTLDGMLRTSHEIATEYSRSVVQVGDIVFALRGQPGMVLKVPEHLDGANLTQGTARIAPDSSVDTDYLIWAIRSEFVQGDILKKLRGSTFREIPLYEIRRLLIPLPPLPEQRKIAEILSTWDEAIALTEALIAALQQRKQALMQLLLTGQVRFPGFDGEWEEVRLGEIATVRRGASPRPIKDPKWFSDTGRAWIRIADVTASPTRFLNEASQYLSPLGEERSVKIEVGELIMSIAATIGVPKIVNVPACIHDGFIVLRDYEDKAVKEFLYHYLNWLTERLANSGQPGTQKNLNSDLVREIRIPELPLEEQETIASVLTESEEEIYTMGLIIEQLHTQKRGLMQELLTGAVRV